MADDLRRAPGLDPPARLGFTRRGIACDPWATLLGGAAVLALAATMLCPRTGSATPPVHIIIDDQDGPPAFTLTGDDWTTWSTLGLGYDASDTSFHYLSSTVGGSDRRGTATWTPELPCAGTYDVATWFRRTGNRTHDADHFVYDGNGDSSHFVIDQYGDGASGWIPLGQHYCGAGTGGCTVVLDGEDDDFSDEANAVRFSLVECEGNPDDNVPACPDVPEPGVHTVIRHAGTAWTSGDWSHPELAVGTADDQAAASPNLDEGELLLGSDWEFCNPPGEETILKVEIGCRGRTQYDSGSYDVLVELTAGGASSTSWHHTDFAWDSLDVTADSAEWGWFDVNMLTAQVGLHSHPGGAKDSDVWVDAFRVEVTYETHGAAEGGAGGSAQGGSSAGGSAGSGGGVGGVGGAGGAPAWVEPEANDDGGCDCRASSSKSGSSVPLLLLVVTLAGVGCRRRRLSSGLRPPILPGS